MKGIIDAGGIPVCSGIFIFTNLYTFYFCSTIYLYVIYLYVKTAGNTQLDGCNYVPGQSQYCISVGAFDEFGNLYSRTNYGTCVAIKSAGTSICYYFFVYVFIYNITNHWNFVIIK